MICPHIDATNALATPILGTQIITDVTNTTPKKPPVSVIVGAETILEKLGSPPVTIIEIMHKKTNPLPKDISAA